MILLGAMAYPQPTTGDNIQSNSILSDRKVNDAFQDGEWFRLRMRYGILNASYATVMLRETTFRDQAVYHVAATGKTTGFARWFFRWMITLTVTLKKTLFVPFILSVISRKAVTNAMSKLILITVPKLD